MKTIYLILSLLIGGYSLPTTTPISNSISYEITPPVEKRKQKVHQRKKKNKKKKARYKKRKHPNKEQLNKKARTFYILSVLFTILWLGLAIGLVALLSGGGGWISLLIAIPLILLAIASLAGSIITLALGHRNRNRNRKKNHKSTLKKEESTLRQEVHNLSKKEQQHYIQLNNELTAAKIKKVNLDRTARQKRQEGMTRAELKDAFDNINYTIEMLEFEIKDLQIKSKRYR